MNNQVSKHKLRPAGRHVLAIGKELIKDNYSAIMELVKNSYDADSSEVDITFSRINSGKKIRITIADYGHGMDREVVVGKWLMPSTNDKLLREVSPAGRRMQGKKGIGRYAAAILGNEMYMETISASGEATELFINWDDYQNAVYMDDVEIEIKSSNTSRSSGTRIVIEGDEEYVAAWDEKQLAKLEYELKKLVSPVHEISEIGNFDIFLICDNYYGDADLDLRKKIEPYPIVEYFDYRISGTIESNGSGNLKFQNSKARNTELETIAFDFSEETQCGVVEIDIRVFDRESESIDALIQKGLKDDSGNYINKTQAKRLLNDSNGIGVYRNGFRIRPLGDPDFDWLELNDKRIQNPSMCVGSNQVIGFIKIQDERESNLEEKSARDGLRENQSYRNLIAMVSEVIVKLQERRFSYRRKEGLGRTSLKIERDFERLFSFEDIKSTVRKRLKKEGVGDEATDEILELLKQKEDDSAKIVDDIKQKVAIYQGQATLGKIINVVLHEGRKPLGYFKNQISNLKFWIQEFKKKPSVELADEMIGIVSGIESNSKIFVDLFSRLDPLATAKRGNRKEYLLKPVLGNSIAVFEGECLKHGISIILDCPNEARYFGWENDIYVIMTNLIDNSIYWIVKKEPVSKKITLTVAWEHENQLNIDYRDSGPGIDSKLIIDGLIFEPEFTTKSGGSGIGLSIAGEAAARNNLELKAFDVPDGAYFRIQSKEANL